MALRIIFMGTPDFSVPTLNALAEAGHEIAAVYCQPPRKGGRRGLSVTPSPVQRAAEQRGLDVRHPTSLKGAAEQEAFAALEADVAVVVAYGLILPKPILEAPRHGCFNGHASKLPRWRGAAPIQRAIMAGDDETAMMVMKMEEGLDTGPVALERTIAISEEMTAGALHDELAAQCATLMVEAMDRLEQGTLETTPQPSDGTSYAAKIDKAETHIDFTRPAGQVHNHIRGMSPIPGAWCAMTLGGQAGQRVKVLHSALVGSSAGSAEPGTVLDENLTIACGTGTVRLTGLQKAGGRPVDAEEFLRGNKVPVGSVLT